MEKINSESKINEIKGLIQRKQYIVAEKKARELLKQIDPKNNYDQQNFVSVVLLLSESLTKNIKNILAIEELEKARKFFPEDERLLEEIFLLSLKMKRLPKAEEFLKEIVALNPAKLENRFRLISFYTDKDDYFNAGLEIRNLAVFGVDNVNINQMLLFCLKKTGSLSEQLKQIKKLQQMLPEDIKLVTEEISILIHMGAYTAAYELLESLVGYRLEAEIFDLDTINLITAFTNLFVYHGDQDVLAGIYIKVLKKFEKIDPLLKKDLEKFSLQMKWDLIFNFLIRPGQKIVPEKLSFTELLQNVTILLQNEINQDALYSYLQGLGMERLFPASFQPFVLSIVEFERA